MNRRRTAATLIAMTMTTGGLALAGAAAPAQAAVNAPIDCPTALPTASAVAGLTGTGFSVEKGTDPDPFTVEVIGRLKDGVAPGIDMIMAEVNSPAVERAGGIWAGISGSPVYTDDGRLIGSVSYGLAGASNVAGLTPGADINKVYSAAAVAKTKQKVAVSAAAAKKIAGATGVSAAAAKGGFKQLPIPVTVSGIHNARNEKALTKLGKKLGGQVVRSGGDVASGAKADPDAIFAGSNFAAAYSYGDVTIGGVGTTTTVCKGVAVAFGHPFDLRNKTSLSAHSADAVYVQADPVFGAFKVANFGGVVGTVDRDLISGIRTQLGKAPGTYPVTASISEDGGAPVNGKTTGVLQQVAPDVAALQLQSQVDLQGGYWEGSGALNYRVTGTRAGGQAFSVSLSDHYADQYWLSASAAFPLYDVVSSLQTQPYEPVKITGVEITGDVTQNYTQWRVNNVRQWKGGAWSASRTISTKPGATIKLRVSLSKYQTEAEKFVYYSVKVPARSSGASGVLSVLGGNRPDVSVPAGTKKFDRLLKQLSTSSNDSLSVSLDLAPAAKPVTVTKRANALIDYYGKDYDVLVK